MVTCEALAETTVLWEGGGGFTLARIGASMYEVDDDGEVYLSPNADTNLASGAAALIGLQKLGPRWPADEAWPCGNSLSA